MTGRVSTLGRTRRTRAGVATRSRSAVDRRSVLLVVPVFLLLIIGLGVMMSASSVVAIRDTGDHLYYFRRQVMWVGLGVIAFVVAARVPYRFWQRTALVGYLAVLALLVATLVVGDVRNGARRWIELGPLTIQVAEFAKLATISLLAAALTKKERWLGSLLHFLVPVAVILGGVGLLLLAQPDFGSFAIVLAASFAVILASAVPLGYVAGIGVLGALVGFVLAVSADYRKARLIGFLDPLSDPLGRGHQAVQSLVALGTGGLFGVGLGASRARWSFLPNAHTDFIFAIIGEETGLVGAMLVVVLFTIFAAVGTVIALGAPDRFGRLLATGLVALISIQALVNVGGVVAVLPITGVPLPFVSSGGNAMVVNLAAVGILLNICRAARGRRADVRP